MHRLGRADAIGRTNQSTLGQGKKATPHCNRSPDSSGVSYYNAMDSPIFKALIQYLAAAM
jgi:hypothetical protein